MNIKLLIAKENEVLDLTNTVEEINVSTSMYDSPGKCEFSLVNNDSYPNGSIVQLLIDDVKFFYGYIFSNEVNNENKTNIVAYDQMRYLKNQDTVYYENKTSAQILEDICRKNNLKCKIVDPSKWVVLGYLHDKKSMFEIIKHSLDETFQMENNLYMIRDNFGTIEHINVINQKTNLQIGTKSLLTEFSFKKSIDDDTYNVVKLIRDNKETQKRDVWQVQDSDTIKKWGKLQYLYNVDEQANEEQIKELANNILKVKNRETRSLSLSTIGFYNLRAGDGIKVTIENVIDEWFYLESVKTSINNNFISTELEVFIT